jgi:hypothetical protein
LPRSTFLNCDLPATVDRLIDPERFFRSVSTPIVVLDEVHQLADPSRVLKIAADEFPRPKILATGSSTLAATQKLRDSLTGRKRAATTLSDSGASVTGSRSPGCISISDTLWFLHVSSTCARQQDS